MGCARKLVFSWGGNPGVGSLHRLPRRGRARAGRRRSSSRSTRTRAWRPPTRPARRTCPFGVLRGYAGTDLAARTRVASDHVPVHGRGARGGAARSGRTSASSTRSRPTGAGNVQLWGITGVQKEAVLASARSIVTVEEIVDELDAAARRGRPARLGRSTPSPSRPAARTRPTRTATTTATTPSTSRWDAISRDRDAFPAWMQRHVLETADVEEYRASLAEAADRVTGGAATRRTR